MSHFIHCCVECHYADCRYAECGYAECGYAECGYDECGYTECPGAIVQYSKSKLPTVLHFQIRLLTLTANIRLGQRL
jgi:hypothetical protein